MIGNLQTYQDEMKRHIWFQKQMFQNLIQLQEQVHKDINDDFKRNLEGHLV
jgi:hypothetical protein